MTTTNFMDFTPGPTSGNRIAVADLNGQDLVPGDLVRLDGWDLRQVIGRRYEQSQAAWWIFVGPPSPDPLANRKLVPDYWPR